MSFTESLTQIFTNQASSQPLGFIIALSLSFLFTPLIKNRAIELKLASNAERGEDREFLNQPRSIPRLGGIAILISLILTICFYLAFFGRYTPKGFEHLQLEGIIIGSLIIFCIGLLDDLKPMHPLSKLSGQFVAASIAWLLDVRIQMLANPVFYFDNSVNPSISLDDATSYLVTVAFLVAISNAINLIDGIDGLAVGVCMIVSIATWAINISPILNQPAAAILSASLAGACLGFLRYNFNPAKIFLGDNGAYLLGFLLGCISCIGLVKTVTVVVLSPILLLIFAVPLFDISYAVIRRVINKKPIDRADLGHIHHRLLELGLNHRQVNYILYSVTFLGGLLGTFLLKTSIGIHYLLITGAIIICWLVISLFNKALDKNSS